MADKQLYVIDDFTGSMNSEADSSDLEPNESLLLENIYPAGKGKLSLDRSRCTVAACALPSATTTLTSIDSVHSFKDTMGNLDVIITKDNYMHVLYSTGALYSTTPVLLDKVEVHEHGAYLPKVTKASFIDYNGITRMGCEGYLFPPATILNFGRTNSLTSGSAYVNRQRFASNNYKVGSDASSHGIAQFNDSSWCGAIDTNYPNRGCGVYPPRVAPTDNAGALAGFTYTQHSLGVYVAESASSSTDSEYAANDKVWLGFSLEYDYSQESPMVVLGNKTTPTMTISVAQYYPTIMLFVPAGTPASDPGWWTDLTSVESDVVVWDERITGINIYRKINDGDFYHVFKVDVTGSSTLYDDSGTGCSWASSTNYWQFKQSGGSVGIAEYGKYSVDTYYSHSGFNDYIETIPTTGVALESTGRFFAYQNMLNWNIGCMFRDMAVVSATYIWDNGTAIIKPHKRVHISMPGKPDVFHPDHWMIIGDNDSTAFKCIQPLGIDRVALFDSNNTYILNAASTDPLGWYVEHTYNMGIASGNAWALLPDGLAFANSKGVYVLDFYGAITEISRKIRTSWSTCTASGCHMHYDRKTNVLYIAKTGLTYNNAGLQFDLENGAWSWWSDDAYSGSNGNDIIEHCMGFFLGYNNETHLAWINTNTSKISTYAVMAPVSGISIRQRYQSPHVDFGTAGVVKTGKHLYIKYKSGVALAVTIYIDGSSSGISLGTIAAASDITMAHLRIPYRFRTLSVKIATNAYNSGVFELDEVAIEFKQGRAK